jgi:hypothetical protein
MTPVDEILSTTQAIQLNQLIEEAGSVTSKERAAEANAYADGPNRLDQDLIETYKGIIANGKA